MTGWRFYPLAEYPRTGILVSPDRQHSKAHFLTPGRAKEIAQQQRGLDQ